jgi:hypothetical protein
MAKEKTSKGTEAGSPKSASASTLKIDYKNIILV